MNCDETKKLLVPRADGTLTQGQAQRVDEHVARCEDCRQELALLRAETALLRADAAPGVPVGLSGRVMAELRSGRRESPPARRLWRAAAVALFAVGVTVGALFGNAISRPVPGEEERVAPMVWVNNGLDMEEGL